MSKLTDKQRQRLDDMADVLKTEQGRRVIWEILDESGFISRNPALDQATMNRHEGRRELGIELYDWVMEASPHSFLNMLKTRADEMEKISS